MEVDYQRALAMELRKQELGHLREAEIPIYYDDTVITRRRVDFVIWNEAHTVLLETKAAKMIRPEDVEQFFMHCRTPREMKKSPALSVLASR